MSDLVDCMPNCCGRAFGLGSEDVQIVEVKAEKNEDNDESILFFKLSRVQNTAKAARN